MPKVKVTAGIYLIVVFASGVMVGVAANRLYMVKTVLSTKEAPTPRRLGPAEWRKHFIEQMQSRVKVDGQQLSKLQEILDDTNQQLRQLHEGRKDEDARRRAEDQAVQNGMIDKINAILREDQRSLYQQLRAEREAERERERRNHQPPGGGPPPK